MTLAKIFHFHTLWKISSILERLKIKKDNIKNLTELTGLDFTLNNLPKNQILIKIKTKLDELDKDKEEKLLFYKKSEDNKNKLIHLYLQHKSIPLEVFNTLLTSLTGSDYREQFKKLFYDIAVDDILSRYNEIKDVYRKIVLNE